MERTRIINKTVRKADAILVSDLHLTDTIPVSRTDDYILAQQYKLDFLQSLSNQNNNCPILCAGDVFDYWKASPWLCSMAFSYLPRPFIGIPGQHDLPMHSLELYGRSALSLLSSVSGLDDINILGVTSREDSYAVFDDLFIVGKPFGTLKDFDPEKLLPITQLRKILILHELVWQNNAPSWNAGSLTDQELLSTFGKYYDLILTGDNHSGFVSRKGNSILVNPGSMLRINADQEDYKPRCYLYYAEENDVKPVYFPIEEKVHNREYIDRKKERDERVAAYVERMQGNWSTGASFRKNLEAFFIENKTPQKIKDVILCHLETEKIEKI